MIKPEVVKELAIKHCSGKDIRDGDLTLVKFTPKRLQAFANALHKHWHAEEFKQFIMQMYHNFDDMDLIPNDKDSIYIRGVKDRLSGWAESGHQAEIKKLSAINNRQSMQLAHDVVTIESYEHKTEALKAKLVARNNSLNKLNAICFTGFASPARRLDKFCVELVKTLAAINNETGDE